MFILSSSIFRWLIDLCCFGKRQLAALPSKSFPVSISVPSSLDIFLSISLFLFLSISFLELSSLFVFLLDFFVWACLKNVCVPLLLSVPLSLPFSLFPTRFQYFVILSVSLSVSFTLSIPFSNCVFIIICHIHCCWLCWHFQRMLPAIVDR